MGLNIDSVLHDIANSTSLNSLFNNPIYISLIIVLIVMIMVYFMFFDYHDFSSLFKLGFYLFIPVSILTFIHYKNIEREFEHTYENKALSNVVSATITNDEKVLTANIV